jgi:Icc-related predicted phosphoesterase
MKVLAISDQVVQTVYSPRIRDRYGDVNAVLGCGDLPYSYLEFITTMLSVPCLFVHGNHDHPEHMSDGRTLDQPGGWTNIDGRTTKVRGWIIAGLEGSRRYRPAAPFQYTESEVLLRMWRMGLSLLAHKILDGRYLDILITHAPPCGIHDGEDECHRGFETYLRFMRRFRPLYLLHGHQHTHAPTTWRTQYMDTEVINVYPSRVLELETHDGDN